MTRSSVSLLVFAIVASSLVAEEKTSLDLKLRKRIETSPGSHRYHVVVEPAKWDAKKTAMIVCDVWDLHHCLNATRRVEEMASRMNDLITEARKRGVTIIHAPSDCMASYQDHPARKRARETPRSKSLPKGIAEWCHRIPSEEKGKYPIDQSDGGEDDDPIEHKTWAEKLKAMGRNPRAPWKTQIDKLRVDDAADFISDSGEEIWSILDQRKIDNVLLIGVHTNMCVLGRPFGLRQMARNGKNVVLVRDMTDTMYNPARPPYVSHFTGTDLIVEHVEKFVCPTVTSDQLLGGKPFRFVGDKRPLVALLLAEDEYKTERTLPEFARSYLGKEFRVHEIHGSDKDRHDVPGIDDLAEADVLVISVRRRLLRPEQLAVVRNFVASGKPIVALRTSSHAFATRDGKVAKGLAAWPEFDRDVLGGNYTGHYGTGVKTTITVAKGAEGHPILKELKLESFEGRGSLYRTSPLAKSTTPLLYGSIPNKEPEPVAWLNKSPGGGRVFYTSLGHEGDFKQPAFNQLLRNAIRWAVDR